MGFLTAPTVKKIEFKNPRWRTAAILKTVKSPYLGTGLTDFDEIWHDDAYWSLTADRPLKFRFFLKMQDGSENRKIAMSPQRFDGSLRKLVR